MPDPNVIAEGLTDMDTWLTGTLTPAVTAINNDLTDYQVSIFAWWWQLLFTEWSCSCTTMI